MRLGFRSALREISPRRLRIAVALARRGWRDLPVRTRAPRFSAPSAALPPGDFIHPVVAIQQEIKRSAFFEGKVANIRLGAALLDGVVVRPGETFSFWKLIGRPSAAAGFALGRSIRNGAVGGDVGGGLCQLSGIAYEAGLRAGLEVAERFPHSRDLYDEESRFTPLGLDATVVWPYKDLRLTNPGPVPLLFRFAVLGGSVSVSVLAPIARQSATITIERTDHAAHRQIRVERMLPGRENELISQDRYAAEP